MLAMALQQLYSIQSIGYIQMHMMVCYYGTNTLIGRYGIVLSTDVAVYTKGPARPTGGVGAIAILIGPDAPIVFDNVRSTFIDHAYDFYKPDPSKILLND